MIRIDVATLSTRIGGRLDRPTGAAVGGISTDTRTLERGDVFVALDGPRHRGSSHAEAAFERGAVAVVTHDDVDSEGPLILVEDTSNALMEIGRLVRSRLDVPVIAVTGSNGKTTTKDAIAVLLGHSRRVVAATASFNNRIGVPLTLARADEATEAVVVECGTNAPGEIAELSRLARPTHALITCIGPAHLEGLGGYDGVVREKTSIVKGMVEHGRLFVNGDDDRLRAALPLERADVEVTTFGLGERCEVRAVEPVADENGVAFALTPGGTRIHAALRGRHNLQNLVGAAAVARSLGLSDEAIATAALGIRSPKMRLEERDVRGMSVTFDCYNANPGSMDAALEEWGGRPVRSRRVAILGDMLELGRESASFHRRLGDRLPALGASKIILVGKAMREAVAAAVAAGIDRTNLFHYEDVMAARSEILSHLEAGDSILLKASRGIGLERLFEAGSV